MVVDYYQIVFFEVENEYSRKQIKRKKNILQFISCVLNNTIRNPYYKIALK